MKACRQVEGLFLSQLMEAMDRPAFGEGMLGNSRATSLFRSRRNQAIADEMGTRGDLGLAEMLYRDLSNQTRVDAAVDAADGADGDAAKGAEDQ
jgi:flagellar protein FlgJ